VPLLLGCLFGTLVYQNVWCATFVAVTIAAVCLPPGKVRGSCPSSPESPVEPLSARSAGKSLSAGHEGGPQLVIAKTWTYRVLSTKGSSTQEH
jgi:hypothetical protein